MRKWKWLGAGLGTAGCIVAMVCVAVIVVFSLLAWLIVPAIWADFHKWTPAEVSGAYGVDYSTPGHDKVDGKLVLHRNGTFRESYVVNGHRRIENTGSWKRINGCELEFDHKLGMGCGQVPGGLTYWGTCVEIVMGRVVIRWAAESDKVMYTKVN